MHRLLWGLLFLTFIIPCSQAEAKKLDLRRLASQATFQLKRLRYNIGRDADEQLSSAGFRRHQQAVSKMDPWQLRQYQKGRQENALYTKVKRGRKAVAKMLKHAKLAQRFAKQGNEEMYRTASEVVMRSRGTAANELSDASHYAKGRKLHQPVSIRVLARAALRATNQLADADRSATMKSLPVSMPRDDYTLLHQIREGYALDALAK
jgi:hypothetical protein